MQRGKGGGLGLRAAALALFAAGAAMALTGWYSLDVPPPIPPASVAGVASGGPARVADGGPARVVDGAAGPASAQAEPRPLGFSQPVHVDIAAIGVHARIIPLGENPDGTAAVPPLSSPFLTSWFDGGAAPGQRGAAVLLGHVDSAWSGRAVFYKLGDLRPGQFVSVTRADRRVAVFRIYSVAQFQKDAFPSSRIYGRTAQPELRLITCGGPFDKSTGSYLDNTVVFARLADEGTT